MTNPSAVELQAGREAWLSLPGGDEAAERRVSPLDLSVAPGVQLTAQRAWQLGDRQMQTACVAAPASSWISGLEGPVLAGASALARKHLGASSLQAEAAVAAGPVLAQRFQAGGMDGAWHGRHLLAFTEDEVVVCTVACRQGGQDSACDDWLARAQLGGALTPPPAPGWLGRLAHGAAQEAAVSGGAVALLVAVAVALLLWRRPRPRW